MENRGDETADREIGKCAAILATVEVGLGSVFHSLHVPTSGHWLSLNQAFWLSRLTFKSGKSGRSRTAPMAASNVTACLKSLSPAGKRLSPMLAISAQGALFNTGTLLLGGNVAGASLGGVLLSVWAFIHPVVIYYLIFGRTLIVAYTKLFKKCQAIFHFSSAQALHAIVLIVAAKAVLAVATVLLARWLPQSQVDRYQERVAGIARRSAAPVGSFEPPARVPAGAAARGALHDLLHPLFLISLGLTAVFFLWSENSHAALIWGLLRPLAIGFILFFGIRMLPVEPILDWMEVHGFSRFASALRFAKTELLKNRH